MNVLANQIIEVSIQLAQPIEENLKYGRSIQKKQRQTKNESISELMTLVAESRKMNTSETNKAELDAAINSLNKKLYEATSLTIF